MSCCGKENRSPKHASKREKKDSSGSSCVTCLCTCCMFWFVICGILVTAIVFIGRHLVSNNVPPGGYFYWVSIQPNSSSTSEKVYRILPKDIKPTQYNLTLLPFLDKDYFEGFVNISLQVYNPKAQIVLHSKGHTIYSVELVQNYKRTFELTSVTDNMKFEVLIIKPKEKIFPGNYSLAIKFRGALGKALGGLYKSTYKSGDKTRTIATSKFEPTYARQAFPCFDEPNMKAKYIVHLLKPKAENYIALSNYPVASIQSYDNNNEIVTFQETVAMSTYLTCFIVSDFTHTKTTFNNNGTEIELRVYASPGNLEKTTYAGEIAKKVIEYYVSYFGLPYPLPKLDMAAIPDFVSGAMEHWGLVTYRETALLYTNTTHSSANKQRVATVIAHELAHSWFGNLVTMDWWNDLWLNEGFASYIEYKGTDAAEPTFQMMTQFQTTDLHPVLSLDATLSSHPIVVTVTSPDEITAIFDTISYNKGASILRMLENAVGADNFQTAVTNYLKKFQFGNAVTKNFLDEIQAVVDPSFDVSQMMDTFTVQMGYPVLNVTYNQNTRNYTLKQKRFLKDPNATYDSNTTYGYKWSVPVTYITDLGRSEGYILFPYDQESITIQLPENATWLKFNYDQVGYYRVNYEESEWLTFGNIYTALPVPDRTHLLEESFSIAEAGQLSYRVPLDLTRQLISELDYAPWSVASSKLQAIDTYLSGSSQNEAYKSYVRSIISNAYATFTWNERADDSHLERLTRIVVLSLSCSVNYPQSLAQVQEKFNTWINDTSKPLSPDLRSIVYKYGAVNADTETWDKLLTVYQKERDASEKLKLMNGLANVKDSSLLAKLLDSAKDESIVRGQDYFTVLGYISANPTGTELVWDFVRQNWEYLVERFTLNDRYLGSMISTITKSFSTNSKLAEMEEFFAKYPEAGAGATSRRTALETVKQNINWLSSYSSTVEDWLATAKN